MRNKITIAVSLVLFVLIIIFTYKHLSGWEIKNAPNNHRVIVAFGDSLIQGVGATDSNDFISRVSTQIKQPIINLGKSGDTTRSALTRLDDVLILNPSIVIVLLGGNDYLQRIPKEETFTNLRTIIQKIQATGSAVLLIGIRGGALRDTYESEFKTFARENHTGYVSNVLKNLIGNKTLMFDSVHPNDMGYKIIAERVTPELTKLFHD